MIRAAFIVVVVLASGCSRQADLQPFVAVAGSYSLLEPSAAPLPPHDACEEGCGCAGTGRERSGDDLETIACRCPESCKCKAGRQVSASIPCRSGTCPTRR